MASDNLNQAGKGIRKIKEDADYASKKVAINKRIERSRDVFDTTVPFEMEFRTHHSKDRIALDLKFTKPPPRKGCNAECFSNNCQTFTFTDGLDHIVNVGVPYIPNTVIVFRNRTKLTFLNFAESDPEAGLVFIQGTSGVNEITVCYVTGDCILEPFDASALHWYQGKLLFDNQTPGGGGGGHGYAAGGGTTVYTSNTAGALFLPSTQYVAAIGMVVGPHDLGFGIGVNSTNVYPPNGSEILGVNGVLGFGATFTTPSTSGLPKIAHVNVKAQPDGTIGIAPHTILVTWVIDPVGWTFAQPQSNQTVINDEPINIGSNIFKVTFPFVLGTLHVFVDGVEVPITENSNQTFIFLTVPVGSTTVLATYEAA